MSESPTPGEAAFRAYAWEAYRQPTEQQRPYRHLSDYERRGWEAAAEAGALAQAQRAAPDVEAVSAAATYESLSRMLALIQDGWHPEAAFAQAGQEAGVLTAEMESGERA